MSVRLRLLQLGPERHLLGLQVQDVQLLPLQLVLQLRLPDTGVDVPAGEGGVRRQLPSPIPSPTGAAVTSSQAAIIQR